MATQVYFNGKLRKLPGAYSRITSGEQNTPANLDFGKVLIIDTGLGAGFGGGSGINGALSTDKDSVYQFTDIDTYKSFLKGGLLWKMAEKLFFPYSGVTGVSTIYHVKAATTEAATMTFTAVGGGTAGGTFKIKTKDEGLIGNGILTSTHLDKGYAYTIEAGVIDTAKWILKIWLGQWKGDFTDGLSFNEVTKASTTPILVVQSPEFNNITELITWADTSKAFGDYFVKDATSAVVGLGTVTAPDVVAAASYVVASGGTEAYATTDLDDVLESIKDLDYQFILLDKYGTGNYDDAYVTKIFAHIKDSATEFNKMIIFGAGKDETEFSAAEGSLAAATYFKIGRAHV